MDFVANHFVNLILGESLQVVERGPPPVAADLEIPFLPNAEPQLVQPVN